MRTRCTLFVPALAALANVQGWAQTVSGTLFDDVNRNGQFDPGEPVIEGLDVSLFGNGGSFDSTTTTDAGGAFLFGPPGSASYVVGVDLGSELRPSMLDLGGDSDPIPDFPVGRLRMGTPPQLIDRLREATALGPLVHTGLGDSIAFGFNLCGSPFGSEGYLEPYTERLGDIALATVLLKLAVPGYESADLLNPSQTGNIFEAIVGSPDLVTISIGGNDFLADDGNEAETAMNLVRARQNLQELVSSLLSELPNATLILNTVYDNEGGNVAFHNRWGPIWNQMIRDVAFGQTRPAGIAEIWPEYEHLDPFDNQIVGHEGLICTALFDGIHPTNEGYDVHEEKVFQGSGGVKLGAAGAVDVQLGYSRKIGQVFASQFEDLGGGASSETNVFALDDLGAVIPAGDEELRLSGFQTVPTGLLTHVVVNVRYRTTATPQDDVYRFEASVDGAFAAPGNTDQTWNTVVPIVGGAGNDGAAILAFPDQPTYRTVSALVTAGSPVDGSPSLSWQNLEQLAVRLQGTATGGSDAFAIEWDAVWLDLYGVPSRRLLVRGPGDVGSVLRFDATGPQGALNITFVAAGTDEVVSPLWGTYRLDNSAIVLFTGFVDQTGTHTLEPTVPAQPPLSGLTAYFQSLIVEGPQLGGFTNLAPVTFP